VAEESFLKKKLFTTWMKNAWRDQMMHFKAVIALVIKMHIALVIKMHFCVFSFLQPVNLISFYWISYQVLGPRRFWRRRKTFGRRKEIWVGTELWLIFRDWARLIFRDWARLIFRDWTQLIFWDWAQLIFRDWAQLIFRDWALIHFFF